MPKGWMPVDRWFAIMQACSCKAGGTHRCADHSRMANMMSAKPFGGNDTPVILTGGAFPDGKVAHGKPSTRLPDLTRLRFGATCDGDYWAIERNSVAMPTPTVATPNDVAPKLPDVVRFADIIGRVGNID